MIHVIPVPTRQVNQAWWAAGPWFERLEARDPLEASADGIRQACLDDLATLWIVWDLSNVNPVPLAAFATEIRRGAMGEHFLNLLGLAGERMSLWLEAVQDALDQEAAARGGLRIVIAGRKGWERVLRQRYRRTRVILERNTVL